MSREEESKDSSIQDNLTKQQPLLVPILLNNNTQSQRSIGNYSPKLTSMSTTVPAPSLSAAEEAALQWQYRSPFQMNQWNPILYSPLIRSPLITSPLLRSPFPVPSATSLGLGSNSSTMAAAAALNNSGSSAASFNGSLSGNGSTAAAAGLGGFHVLSPSMGTLPFPTPNSTFLKPFSQSVSQGSGSGSTGLAGTKRTAAEVDDELETFSLEVDGKKPPAINLSHILPALNNQGIFQPPPPSMSEAALNARRQQNQFFPMLSLAYSAGAQQQSGAAAAAAATRGMGLSDIAAAQAGAGRNVKRAKMGGEENGLSFITRAAESGSVEMNPLEQFAAAAALLRTHAGTPGNRLGGSAGTAPFALGSSLLGTMPRTLPGMGLGQLAAAARMPPSPSRATVAPQRKKPMPGSAKKSSGKTMPTVYRGVTFEESSGRYRTRIKINGKTTHIGYYETPADAAVAFDKEAIKLRGIKAQTNFPIGNYFPELKNGAIATNGAPAAAPRSGTASSTSTTSPPPSSTASTTSSPSNEDETNPASVSEKTVSASESR